MTQRGTPKPLRLGIVRLSVVWAPSDRAIQGHGPHFLGSVRRTTTGLDDSVEDEQLTGPSQPSTPKARVARRWSWTSPPPRINLRSVAAA